MHKDPRSTQPIPNYFQGEDSHDPLQDALDATPVPCESDACTWPVLAPIILGELRAIKKSNRDILEILSPMAIKLSIGQWIVIIVTTMFVVPVIGFVYSKIFTLLK